MSRTYEQLEPVISALDKRIKKTGDEISELKSDLSADEDFLIKTDLNNQIIEWEIGQRYIDAGTEKWSGSTDRISLKRGKILKLKNGDKVYLTKPNLYQMYFGYSTNNGSSWSQSSNTNMFTASADMICFPVIKKIQTGSFTQEEVNALPEMLVFVPAEDDLEKRIENNEMGVAFNRHTLDVITGGTEVCNMHKIKEIWLTAGATNTITVGLFTADEAIAGVKGDKFNVFAEIVPLTNAGRITSFSIVVSEGYGENGWYPGREISNIDEPFELTLNATYTNKFTMNVKVYAGDGAGYFEQLDIKLHIVKVTGAGDADYMTEAGQIWEV